MSLSFVFSGLSLEPPSSSPGAEPSLMFWAGPCWPPPVPGKSRYPSIPMWPALAPALQAAIRNMSEIAPCWLGLLVRKGKEKRSWGRRFESSEQKNENVFCLSFFLLSLYSRGFKQACNCPALLPVVSSKMFGTPSTHSTVVYNRSSQTHYNWIPPCLIHKAFRVWPVGLQPNLMD